MKELQNKANHSLGKFILTGLINTIFGSGIMFIFYNVFHLSYWVSSVSNYFFGSILSYFLNRSFTFQNKEKIAKTLPKFIVNICLCYLLAYGFAKPLTAAIFTTLMTKNTRENISLFMGMCLFVGLNYIGQRLFVFKETDAPK